MIGMPPLTLVPHEPCGAGERDRDGVSQAVEPEGHETGGLPGDYLRVEQGSRPAPQRPPICPCIAPPSPPLPSVPCTANPQPQEVGGAEGGGGKGILHNK